MIEDDKEKEEAQAKINKKRPNGVPPVKILTSGKVMGNHNTKWNQVIDNRPKKNIDDGGKEKTGQELGIVEPKAAIQVTITNKFALLEGQDVRKDQSEEVVVVNNVE